MVFAFRDIPRYPFFLMRLPGIKTLFFILTLDIGCDAGRDRPYTALFSIITAVSPHPFRILIPPFCDWYLWDGVFRVSGRA
jgi:hypothetical protein